MQSRSHANDQLLSTLPSSSLPPSPLQSLLFSLCWRTSISSEPFYLDLRSHVVACHKSVVLFTCLAGTNNFCVRHNRTQNLVLVAWMSLVRRLWATIWQPVSVSASNKNMVYLSVFSDTLREGTWKVRYIPVNVALAHLRREQVLWAS